MVIESSGVFIESSCVITEILCVVKESFCMIVPTLNLLELENRIVIVVLFSYNIILFGMSEKRMKG